MTVKQLREMLENYPDDMEIIHDMCSDYCTVGPEDWDTVVAVPTHYGAMREHPTMSDDNKAKAKMYLHLEGN